MEHLEYHQHAFINEENIVINVSVFEESSHNHQILNDVKNILNAKDFICCCTFGIADVGDLWTGSAFKGPQPFESWSWNEVSGKWEAPEPIPADGNFFWDESQKKWVTVASFDIIE